MEIFTAGVWGTITDSDWTSEDAQPVCRMLGYFKPGNYLATKVLRSLASHPVYWLLAITIRKCHNASTTTL